MMDHTEIIGIIRILPIMMIISFAIYRRKPALVIYGLALTIGVVANAFNGNQEVVNIMGVVSSYAIAWVLLPSLIKKRRHKDGLQGRDTR